MGKGGGGAGGGGGGSGAVSYPAYMETMHSGWLTGMDATIAALLASTTKPYRQAGAVAYNPDIPIAAMQTAIDAVITLATITPLTEWQSYVTAIKTAVDLVIMDSTYIANATTAYDTILTNELAVHLGKFEAGMRDINAVQSSAFVIGRAILTDSKNSQVAKYTADISLQSILQRNKIIFDETGSLLDTLIKVIDERRLAAHDKIDAYRMQIAAKKEQTDENLRIDVEDELWDVKLYQHGANLLASIQGGVTRAGHDGPGTLSSAIGGAMSGAAAGAMIAGASKGAIAGPVGMGIGATLGLAASIFR